MPVAPLERFTAHGLRPDSQPAMRMNRATSQSCDAIAASTRRRTSSVKVGRWRVADPDREALGALCRGGSAVAGGGAATSATEAVVVEVVGIVVATSTRLGSDGPV